MQLILVTSFVHFPSNLQYPCSRGNIATSGKKEEENSFVVAEK